MSEHLSWEQLCDYWAEDAQGGVEEHLMGCDACTQLSASVAAISEPLRNLVPPLITAATLAKLATRGLCVVENPMLPGDRRDVLFPADADLLIHRLGGLALADVTRVDFKMWVEETGEVLAAIEAAPFDARADSVLLVCQQHYASLPPNVVGELAAKHADGSETRSRYTILHRFERQI